MGGECAGRPTKVVVPGLFESDGGGVGRPCAIEEGSLSDVGANMPYLALSRILERALVRCGWDI